ncbi:hypothetical protein BDZ97DRAFT_1729215 [Flammula alnicola]|nr:hypothetical protein BDZ97DRAFT_1729215 [Flammula alnicola]
MVFSSLLASEAGLGYVWDDYTWNRDGSNYSEFNGRPIPSRIPLSTMISGHILGRGPRDENESLAVLPRSISSRVYERLCPPSERVIIHRDSVKAHLQESNPSLDIDNASGEEILDAWLSYLEIPAVKESRCIEVKKDTDHVFDIWLLGSTRMHNLWDRLSRSPVLTQWGWSPLIHGAFEKNLRLFASEKDFLSNHHSIPFGGLWGLFTRQKRDSSSSPTSSQEKAPAPLRVANPLLLNDSAPLPILALHLRRGDFKEHCLNLAEWSATYTGVNSFPEFRVRDKFDVPRVAPSIDSTTNEHRRPDAADDIVVASMGDRKEIYVRHCFPDAAQIVKRVREVVHDYELFAEERDRRRRATKSTWWSWKGVSKEITERKPNKDDDGHRSHSEIREETERRSNIVGRGVAKSKALRSQAVSSKTLKRIYIMTNGDKEWLAEVKAALIEDAARSNFMVGADGGEWEFEWVWEDVSTSRDLQLGWEEKPVAQALDSYVAQRAEVFVGNGFSSLTSNIVMLRKQKGFDPVQTRFW